MEKAGIRKDVKCESLSVSDAHEDSGVWCGWIR